MRPATLTIVAGGPTLDATQQLTIPDVVPSWVNGSADLNGDGYMDLILTQTSAEVRFGGPFPFSKADLVLPATRSYGTPQDFDGDGYPDVLAGNDSNVFLFLGGPSMDATADLTFAAGSAGYAAYAGDVNGDGRADVLIGRNLYFGASPPDATADLLY